MKLFLHSMLFCSVLFAVFMVSTSAHAFTITRGGNTLGLVGWWTFDGKDMVPNVRDASGQGNHGNLIGQAATTTTIGKLGQALSFDGVDDYVDLGSTITSTLNASFSVSFWYYHTTGSNQNLFGNRTSLNSRSIAINNSGNNIKTMEENVAFINAWSIPAGWENNWHHLTWTYDNISGRNILYGDAASKSDITYIFTTTFSGKTFISDDDASYLGFIDDVRIYNRALSAAEVRALYNQSAGAKQNTTTRTGANSSGLVGHWTFDGKDMISNVKDISGQGNHGNLIGQAATTTTIGKIGQALSFDGTGYINTSHIAQLETGDVTFAFWVKPDTIVGGPYMLMQQFDSSPSRGWTLYTGGSGSGAMEFQSGGNDLLTNSGFVQAGIWTHVVAVNSGGTFSIYKNGVLAKGPTVVTVTDNSTASDFTIGGPAEVGVLPFPGQMDDVRVYNRALSLAEIRALYNQSAGAKQNTTTRTGSNSSGLVGHWTFDGKDMISNVKDISGSGNHGNLLGQAATTTAQGKIGQALKFDGVDDYVNLNTNTLIGTQDITICTWLYQRTSPTNRFNFIMANTNLNFSVDTYNEPSMNLLFSSNAGGNSAGSGTFLGNTWIHTCVIREGSTATIYINGAVSGSLAQNSGTPTSSAFPLVLGSYTSIGGSWLSGTLDDTRLYDRILSAFEIKQLYSLGR